MDVSFGSEAQASESSVALPANVARNFRSTAYDRAADNWYVEPRWCVEMLADAIDFCGDWIWDPCCGGGTIPSVFTERRNPTVATDIVDRGYPFFSGIWDATGEGCPNEVPVGARVSVVMNPPFKLAEDIARRMLRLADRRVVMLQQLSFLASVGRQALFSDYPPSDILILSKRPSMPPGHKIAELGPKAFKGGTTDFCWIVWTKPHDRETRVRWMAPGAVA